MRQVLKTSAERYDSVVTECLCQAAEYYYEDFVHWDDEEEDVQEIVDCFSHSEYSDESPWNSCIDNLTVYSYCLRDSDVSIID